MRVGPPPQAQGYRIWKLCLRRGLSRTVRAESSQQAFALRFRSVLDPILLCWAERHAPTLAKPRMGLENFHMRYPCPQAGEGAHFLRGPQSTHHALASRG